MPDPKTALLIGASSGIGLAICASMLRAGSEVVAVVRDEKKLTDNLSSLADVPLRLLHPIETELGDPDRRKDLIREIRRSRRIFDSLVFAAGLGFGKRLGMISSREVSEVLEINFLSYVHLFQDLTRSMGDPSSAVVLSSHAAQNVIQGNSIYGASKTALERASASFAHEFVNAGIRVNCVAPTLVATPMLDMMDQKSRDLVLSSTNSQRELRVEEVCEIIHFLLSSKSNAINGQVIKLGENLRREAVSDE